MNGIQNGFMVSFNVLEGSIVHSDHFPDKHAGEALIPTETEAWTLAKMFAETCPKNYINIYVIEHDFSPVSGYSDKKLRDYDSLKCKAFQNELHKGSE